MAEILHGDRARLGPEAAKEGELWSARARDWSAVQEGFLDPCYLEILNRVAVGEGQTVLDIGCGAGRFLELAAGRGAKVTGLDAAAGMLELAQTKVPEGHFRLGDLENLPFSQGEFDLVTSFNSLSHAGDPENALRGARRVTKTHGAVAITVWGPPEPRSLRSVVSGIVRSLNAMMVKGRSDRSEDADLLDSVLFEEDLDRLVKDAGLFPEQSGEVECRFFYPDERVLLRGLMSPGPLVEIAGEVGEERVRGAILAAMQPYRTTSGSYLCSSKFRCVIARVREDALAVSP